METNNQTNNDIELHVYSKKTLEAAKNQRIQIEIEEDRYFLEPDQENQENQVISLRLFLIPSLIMTLVFYLFFYFRGQFLIPLTGRISIASTVIILGVISSLLTFSIFFVRWKKKGQANLEKIKWRNFPTIMISFAIVITIGMIFSFWIFGRLFEGLVLDIYLASLFNFVLMAAINYSMINFILILSPSLMIKVLVTVILVGVIISMITNSEAQWWQDNISFLGTQDAALSWQFNLTLILSTFLLIALVDYIFVVLKEIYPKHRGLVILQVLLWVMSISLGLVGFFPADGRGNSPAYHNWAAGMLVIAVLLMIIGIKWFIPKITWEFQATSYAIGLLIVLVTYLFVNGNYITLTGFEIVAFLLAFSWLMLLFQNLERLAQPEIPTYKINIKYIRK